MVYRILKGNTNIKKYGEYFEVTTENVEDIFTSEGRKKIIYTNISSDRLILLMNVPSNILNKIYECVINDTSNEDTKSMLIRENIPLFSILINIINSNKKYYKSLNEIADAEKIYFECDNDNFDMILHFCENISLPVVIDGKKISLNEYYNILSNYDIDRLAMKDIKICYQDYNGLIDIRELYDISIQINYITNKINKYNLSPLEQIFLVFDIVKNNFYVEERDIDSPNLSRTLDNVLKNNYIVCAGYVSLMNAILRSLGYNTGELLCDNNNHCRTMIYIKDDKYNIDGVYVFDPTFDSKINETDDCDDNYDFCALPYKVANKTSKAEIFDIFALSLSELKEKNKEYSQIDDWIKMFDKFKILFLLVGNSNEEYDYFIERLFDYDMLSYSEKEELNKIYDEVMSKYIVEDIKADIFMKALYNVRRIEYYLSDDIEQNNYSSRLSLPKVEKINIPAIKNAIIKRYCKVALFSTADKNILLNDLEMYFYEVGLDTYLTKNLSTIVESSGSGTIDKDIINMQLLKVLRKVKNKKTSQ